MATIFRTSDRVPLKIDDVTFKLAPYSVSQKMNINTTLTKSNGTSMEDIGETTKLLIQYSVKDVDGVYYADGEKFQLQFDEGKMTDECLDELLNMQMSPKLVSALMQMLNGIPEEIIDHQTGEKMEGVEIVLPKGGAGKK